jgi:hypothetical protein
MGRRLILSALGLVVAVVASWPLGWLVLVIALGCTWVPLVVWAVLTGARPWPVGAGLVVAIASVRFVLPGSPGDRTIEIVLPVLALYLIVELAAVLVAAWLRRPPLSPDRRQVALGLTPVLLAGCCVGGIFAVVGGTPVPSRAELLPLPAPLHLVGSGAIGCGPTGEWCYRTFTVGGPPGMGPEEVRTVLSRHLATAKGWDRETSTEGGCRPTMDFRTRICLTFDKASDPSTVPGTVGLEIGLSRGVG